MMRQTYADTPVTPLLCPDELSLDRLSGEPKRAASNTASRGQIQAVQLERRYGLEPVS
jgi:hypothetical protein